MIVETAILDREHGLLDALWNRGERDWTPLFALAAGERGEHRRVQRDPLAQPVRDPQLQDAVGGTRRRRPARRRSNVGLLLSLKHDAYDLPLERRHAWIDGHGAAPDRELAGAFRLRTLCVAEIVQTID